MRSFALDQTARAHARHVGTGTADGFETGGNFFSYGSAGALYVVGLLLRCQFDVYFARDRQRDFILLGTIVPPEHPHNIAWGDADGRTLCMCAKTGLYRVRLNIPGIRP